MISSNDINLCLEALYECVEKTYPKAHPMGLGTPELIKSRGSFGSVILGALISGDREGKLSLVLDWNSALHIAEHHATTPLEAFNEEAASSLYTFFVAYAEGLVNLFANQGSQLELRPMPLLTDSHFLASEEGVDSVIRLPIQSGLGSWSLYLSLK